MENRNVTARTFPRADAIDWTLPSWSRSLKSNAGLARRHEPVARRRLRRLDGGREQPTEAPEHEAERGREHEPPHQRSNRSTSSEPGEATHTCSASTASAAGSAPTARRERTWPSRTAHEVARGQHVDVVAGGGERDRAAADGDACASTAPRLGRRRTIRPPAASATHAVSPASATSTGAPPTRTGEPAALRVRASNDGQRPAAVVDGDDAAIVGGERDRALPAGSGRAGRAPGSIT